MSSPVFFPISLLVVLLSAGIAPVEPWLRVVGGALLLTLWGYGLWRAGAQKGSRWSSIGYLPGHALLFLGLGLVGARAGLWAWLPICPLTFALDVALRSGRRFLAATFYAILWLDLFAVLHQLVALGRKLSEWALWVWSIGVGASAFVFVAIGVLRILKASQTEGVESR